MTSRSGLRRWINRDDGKLFRVENHDLKWYQVVGCLSMISGAMALQMTRWGVAIPAAIAWGTVGLGAIFFAAPWLERSESFGSPNQEAGSDKPSNPGAV